MPHTGIQYTKLRWLLTIGGLILYIVDIGTDIQLALRYFQEEHYTWGALTLVFVLAGLLVTQTFSYAWYRDDVQNVLINPEGKSSIHGMSAGGLAVAHLAGVGIFTRYDNGRYKCLCNYNQIAVRDCCIQIRCGSLLYLENVQYVGHMTKNMMETGITTCKLQRVLVCFAVYVIRYFHLLKKGFTVVWTRQESCTEEEKRDMHHHLFCHATDLSMLKLFEVFTESIPQLLLQLYVMLGHNESSVMQCTYSHMCVCDTQMLIFHLSYPLFFSPPQICR